MFNRIKAVARKEVKQFLRDKRMLAVIFVFPVFLLILFGYAVNFDVQNIQLGILDFDNSQTSREYVKTLASTSYFSIVDNFNNYDEAKEALEAGDVQVVLVMPEKFENDLRSGPGDVKIQYLIDGVEGNTAGTIQNYVESATRGFNKKYQSEILADFGMEFKPPVDLQPIFWFNPDLQTTKFLIPGLIALILIVTAVITVSLSLVREKERGTIEQINVSSINTIELLLGKTLPYLVISFMNAVIILVAGYFLFDVTVKGSYFLLILSTLVFLFTCTSVGILISVIADSQQVAFSLATFFSLLPSVILSGFVFPISGMPFIIQIFTNVSPAKFFIICLRAIVLRGVGLPAFWDQILYLLIFALVALFLATKINHKKLMQG